MNEGLKAHQHTKAISCHKILPKCGPLSLLNRCFYIDSYRNILNRQNCHPNVYKSAKIKLFSV